MQTNYVCIILLCNHNFGTWGICVLCLFFFSPRQGQILGWRFCHPFRCNGNNVKHCHSPRPCPSTLTRWRKRREPKRNCIFGLWNGNEIPLLDRNVAEMMFWIWKPEPGKVDFFFWREAAETKVLKRGKFGWKISFYELFTDDIMSYVREFKNALDDSSSIQWKIFADHYITTLEVKQHFQLRSTNVSIISVKLINETLELNQQNTWKLSTRLVLAQRSAKSNYHQTERGQKWFFLLQPSCLIKRTTNNNKTKFIIKVSQLQQLNSNPHPWHNENNIKFHWVGP